MEIRWENNTGESVTVDLYHEGNMQQNLFPIAGGNNTVWIMDPNNQLEIRPVEIVYRGPEEVFVEAGLEENEQLVATDIAAPVPGMSLRLAEPEEQDIEQNAEMARQ